MWAAMFTNRYPGAVTKPGYRRWIEVRTYSLNDFPVGTTVRQPMTSITIVVSMEDITIADSARSGLQMDIDLRVFDDISSPDPFLTLVLIGARVTGLRTGAGGGTEDPTAEIDFVAERINYVYGKRVSDISALLRHEQTHAGG